MFSSRENSDSLFFSPLGGVGEIGMNAGLYFYKGKYLLVDLGIGFSGGSIPGVDILVPDISFLIKNRKNLLGIVITHAHEDHYGALPHLWEELRCPIYCTKFAASLIRVKLASFGLEKITPINIVEYEKKFNIGSFGVEFIELVHSIPEMSAIAIRTPENGLVLHTGDWKIDEDNPRMGRIKEIGEEGVKAVVCDSTNVMVSGRSKSEQDLCSGFREIISRCKKAIVLTMFASNVERIKTIYNIAKEFDRKIVVVGRSLLRIISAAQENGYLEGMVFLGEQEIPDLPREKILFLCTGCQGEESAAMTKFASGNACFTLEEGDSAIFSSKGIPGNEKKIYNLFNKFASKEIEIFSEHNSCIHSSGHATRDDLKEMYRLLKPKWTIPVHGEPMHIWEHTKLAKEIGVDAVKISNGNVLEISDNVSVLEDKIDTGFFGVDGNILQNPDGEVIRTRRAISKNGVIVICIILDESKRPIMPPIITAPGILHRKYDSNIIKKISNGVEGELFSKEAKDAISINKSVRHSVRNILKKELNKDPLVCVQIRQKR